MTITPRDPYHDQSDRPDRLSQTGASDRPALRPVPDDTPPPHGEMEPVVVDGEIVDPEDHTVPTDGDRSRSGGVDPSTWSVDLDVEDGPGEDDAPVPVDPQDRADGDLPAPWRSGPPERRPILPTWVKDRGEAKQAAAWAVRHVRYTTAYHAVRTPKYAGRMLTRSPLGVARMVRHAGRWVFDADARPLRLEAIRRNDAEEYRRLEKMRQDRVRLRVLLVVVALAVVVTFASVVAAVASPLVKALVGMAVVIALGLAGSSADKPLVDPATVVPRARKLSADVVTRAFLAAGLCKDDNPVTFPAPIMRDGPGWRAVVDLPWGVTADKAIKRRVELAAGLDLDEVQVWPERVRGTSGSARRVSLWVADEDPYAKPSGTWPLVTKGTVNIFDPFPFGQDQRGSKVDLQLMFTNLIVGSVPRMGKTFAARLPVLAAALDPVAELHVYDGKGGQDWRMFTPIAARTGFGVREEVVVGLRDDLAALVVEMNARYDRIGELPEDVCPESKITPELARKRSLGLHPIIVAIDEFQRYSEHPDLGKDIVALLTDLAKVGPAVGIMLVLATQKPDTDSIPTKLRDNIGTRFALKTMTWQASEAVLGAGTYPAGYDASRFQRAHKGVGWLLGADDSGAVEEAVTVRTYLAAPRDAKAVIGRAYQAREKAGTLPTPAVDDGKPTASLLDDLVAVVPAGEDKVHSETLLDRLRDLRPDQYTGWTPAQLGTAVKAYGLDTRQVWATDPATGQKRNRYGLDRAAIHAAHRARKRG